MKKTNSRVHMTDPGFRATMDLTRKLLELEERANSDFPIEFIEPGLVKVSKQNGQYFADHVSAPEYYDYLPKQVPKDRKIETQKEVFDELPPFEAYVSREKPGGDMHIYPEDYNEIADLRKRILHPDKADKLDSITKYYPGYKSSENKNPITERDTELYKIYEEIAKQSLMATMPVSFHPSLQRIVDISPDLVSIFVPDYNPRSFDGNVNRPEYRTRKVKLYRE